MKNKIEKLISYYQTLRQQFHTIPELRYEETQTAQLIVTELQKIGLTPQMGIGKTGVVAVLDSGKPGKTVALRADIDALPMTENTALPHQSKIPGKMHACGHDGHTATLLATAKLLTELKTQLRGKIKFIFQPAEEGGAGAKAMIADGVLKNPDVDVIFAFHNHPGYETNLILTRPHCILYSNSDFNLTIFGKGGHAASPNTAIDPIIIGATIIQNLANIMRQINDAVEPIIASITQFHAGTATNIIPATATLSGTVRASSKEKNKAAQQQLLRLFEQTAYTFGGNVECIFKDKYPATINTLAETEFVLNTARELFGETKTQIKPSPARASEDFSFYLQQIPGCYFLIGAGIDHPSCHSDKFDFNDEIMPTAIEILATLAIRYLSK